MVSTVGPFGVNVKQSIQQEVTVMKKIKVQKNRNYLGTLLG